MTPKRRTAMVAVAHLKGGSGATSVCVNAAAGLALAGHPTIILDLDPIAAATFHLVADNPEPTVADVLERRAPLPEALVAPEGVPRLRLLPGSPRMSAWDRKPERFPVDLARLLEEIPADAEAVLIDLPPSSGAIVRGTLAVLPGGRVLAPVQARGLDLVGFSDLVALLEELADQNPDLHLAGIVPTRTNRTRLCADVLEALTAEHGRKVLPGIRDATAVASAPLEHRPVQLSAPRSAAAGDFHLLTRRLVSDTLKR